MIATFLTTVNIRSQPSTNSEIVGKYYDGETVRYDQTIENEERLWISYIGQSGNRRYCCARDKTGEIYIDNVVKNDDNINSHNRSNNNNNNNHNDNNNNDKYNNNNNDNNNNNNNNNDNTNVFPFLQKQSKYAVVRKEGCLFCTVCFLGGLNNINEVDECFEWAVEGWKVRGKDCYVNIEKYDLAKQIAEKYGRNYRNYKIIEGNNHFYVVDSNGNEIYNSAGAGWGHYTILGESIEK